VREFAPIVLGMTLLTGCGSDVSKSDYPGTYVHTRPDTKETIEIIADGRYKHRREWSGKQVFYKEGYWQKDVAGGNAGITFIAFNNIGYWFVVPERSWMGKVLLCVDADYEVCFEKVQ
jgi:hypothetical protein